MAMECSSSSSTYVTNDSDDVVLVNSGLLGSNHPKCNVWGFFAKYERKVHSLPLTVCGKDYAYHGGTSNLRDHLFHCHSKEFQPAIVSQLINY